MRWNKQVSETSDFSLQMYYDRTERIESVYEENRDTFDFDFQYHSTSIPRHQIVWGLGYRYTSDEFRSFLFAEGLIPDERKDDLYSAFLQDTIDLAEDCLKLTVGSKFEYNDYTGFEAQPSARLAFTPDERNTTWFAVSRAVRTPSRAEHNLFIPQVAFPNPLDPMGPPQSVYLVGDNDFDSEELIAYEIGHRLQYSDRMSIDLAAFIDSYDRLRTFQSGTPFLRTDPQPHIVLPQIFDNEMDGNVYGVEISTDLPGHGSMAIGRRVHLHADPIARGIGFQRIIRSGSPGRANASSSVSHSLLL
jgi:iron complex outermembrane receptor protein